MNLLISSTINNNNNNSGRNRELGVPAYLPIAGFTSTCPQTEVNDNPTDLGTILYMFSKSSYPAVVGLLNPEVFVI